MHAHTLPSASLPTIGLEIDLIVGFFFPLLLYLHSISPEFHQFNHIQRHFFYVIGCHTARPPRSRWHAPQDCWKFGILVSRCQRERMLMTFLSGTHQDAPQQNLL